MLKTVGVLVVLVLTAMHAIAADEPRNAAGPANAFADVMYASLAKGDGNLFFSPYSVHSALGMALAGARGETARQMQEVLQVASADAAAGNFATLAAHLDGVRQRSGFELNIANSLWAEQTIPFEGSFLALMKERYRSELMQVSYRTDPDDARNRINRWIADATKEKIPELIPSGTLTRATRLVLANAIYFKAAWMEQFEKSASRDGDFTTGTSRKVTAKMMHGEFEAPYAQTEELQILELPYRGGATSMLIVLPKAGAGIEAAERQVSALADLKLPRATVQTTLPRFKLRYQADLAKLLAGMGMPLAFSGNADFSGMTRAESLLISNVIHEAYVDVNEEGTEAAAATAVVMKAVAMPMQREVVTFTADHPFLFLIRDNASRAILFVGRVTDPS